MTVQEHLELYATLKGVPAAEKRSTVQQMMKDERELGAARARGAQM